LSEVIFSGRLPFSKNLRLFPFFKKLRLFFIFIEVVFYFQTKNVFQIPKFNFHRIGILFDKSLCKGHGLHSIMAKDTEHEFTVSDDEKDCRLLCW
jgi:hypothetical protein